MYVFNVLFVSGQKKVTTATAGLLKLKTLCSVEITT